MSPTHKSTYFNVVEVRSNDRTKLKTKELPAIIGQRNISFYWKVLLFPIGLVLIMNILVLFEDGLEYLIYISSVLLFFYEAAVFIFQYKGSVKECAVIGGISGFVLGFGDGCVRLIESTHFYLFFSLIIEAFLVCIFGMIITGGAAFLIIKISKFKPQILK